MLAIGISPDKDKEIFSRAKYPEYENPASHHYGVITTSLVSLLSETTPSDFLFRATW